MLPKMGFGMLIDNLLFDRPSNPTMIRVRREYSVSKTLTLQHLTLNVLDIEPNYYHQILLINSFMIHEEILNGFLDTPYPSKY